MLESNIGQASNRFFYHAANDPDALLFPARVMMSLVSAGLCLVVFFCGQRFFGALAGLIAEILCAFDPSFLGHGPLVASDVAAALFFLAATWRTWELFQCVSARNFTLAGLSVAGLCLSKMSAPIFAPIILFLALIAALAKNPLTIRLGRYRRSFETKWAKSVSIAACSAALAGCTILAIWAAFDFRFAATTDSGEARAVLDWRWNYFLSSHSKAAQIGGFARRHQLLPEAYLYGLVYIAETTTERPAFLDGETRDTGFTSYFPRAFLYKTPLSLLLLLAAAVALALTRWRTQQETFPSDLVRFAPLWILLLVYALFALRANVNIGHRYLFPVYPPLYLFAGAAVAAAWRGRLVRPMLVALLAGQIAESVLVRPDYLAYFNPLAGGPANGYKHLVDSALDWGQDLPALKSWLTANRFEKIYLAYFGKADPAWYQIRGTNLPLTDARALRPGQGVYCISATILQHVYETEQGAWQPKYEEQYQAARRWADSGASGPATDPSLQSQRTERFHRLQFARLCAYLRGQAPIATAGHSILIYVLTDADVRQALDGPPKWQ